MTIRIDLNGGVYLGPGKVRMLELIMELGSISAAGRTMGMSYRRAWLLVDELNHAFTAPLVTTQHGGVSGGGAQVTSSGQDIVALYRAIEAKAHQAVTEQVATIEGLLPKADNTAPDAKRLAPLDQPRRRRSTSGGE